MIIALTGHREQRLNLPSDVALDDWKNIRQWIRQQIIDNKADTVLSGMAGGSDLAIAYEVVQMKKEGYPIKLTCVFPCKNYNVSNQYYKYITNNADNIVEIHDEWFKGCDNDRDQYMVDNCDILLAIFDGNKNGGVYSTIRKAEKKNKKIIYYLM